MKEISVVIICKNEARLIGSTIQSVRQLTGDIVCVDNGSTDETKSVIVRNGATLIEAEWEGYGKTKNKGIAAARYDWILSLDADEPVDQILLGSMLKEPLNDPATVYHIYFKTFFGRKEIRYGEWGRTEKHIRLFNRTQVMWADAKVHEQLILPENVKFKTLTGYILHRTTENATDLALKTVQYAILGGDKYFEQNKRSRWPDVYFAPAFSFIRHYFLGLGFLDGWEGYLIARMNAHYVFLKYARLRDRNKNDKDAG